MTRTVVLESFVQTESLAQKNKLGGETVSFDGAGGSTSLDYLSGYASLDSTGGGWAGFFCTFKGKASNPFNLHSNKMYGPLLATAYQASLVSVQVEVTGLAGMPLTIRIENGVGTHLQTVSPTLSGGTETLSLVISGTLTDMNRVVIVAENGLTNVNVLSITLELSDHVFAHTFEQLSFDAFCGMAKLYNPTTHRVTDTSNHDYDELSSTAMGGTFALMLLAAKDRGWVEETTAQTTAALLIDAMLATVHVGGWFAHFTKAGGVIADGSEYSTVDTAIGLLSGIVAAEGLGLSSQQAALLARINTLDYSDNDFIHSTLNRVTHGYENDGVTVKNSYWDYWGSESAFVQLLYWMQETESTAFNINQTPPSWNGTGFVTEMAALLFEALGSTDETDEFGNTWKTVRQNLKAEQSSLAGLSVYGYSEMEVLRNTTTTEYKAFGSGGNQTPVTTDADGNGHWATPSYMLMVSSVDPAGVLTEVQTAKFQSLARPYGVAESAMLNSGTNTIERRYWLLSAIRLFFSCVGAYHGLIASEGGTDALYAASTLGTLGDALDKYVIPTPPEEPEQPDLITAWEKLITSSTIPDNSINTAWDHQHNQDTGGYIPPPPDIHYNLDTNIILTREPDHTFIIESTTQYETDNAILFNKEDSIKVMV